MTLNSSPSLLLSPHLLSLTHTASFQYKLLFIQTSLHIHMKLSSIFKETDVVVQANQNEVASNVVLIDVPANDDGGMRSSSVQKEVDKTSSSSSSIGVLSDGGVQDDEDGEEALSKADPDEGSLTCLAALEAALPLKRGLSGHYDGKSRTFMNLNEVKSVKEIEKKESPLNKRRRLTVAKTTLSKWGSSSSSSSMPYLRPVDDEKIHNTEVEQEVNSSTSSNSFNSVNSTTNSSIN